MHVVFDGTAPEWRPVMRHEREVESYVGLDAHVDAEEHERPVCHRVRSGEEPRGSRRKDPDGYELPGVKILRHPDAWGVVLVVDAVYVTVQEPDLVMDEMPDEIFRIKDSQGDVLLPAKLPETGGGGGEGRLRGPYKLGNRDRYNIQDVIPHGEQHGLPHLGPGHWLVRLDFVSLDPFPILPTQIYDHPWEHTQHVHADG